MYGLYLWETLERETVSMEKSLLNEGPTEMHPIDCVILFGVGWSRMVVVVVVQWGHCGSFG